MAKLLDENSLKAVKTYVDAGLASKITAVTDSLENDTVYANTLDTSETPPVMRVIHLNYGKTAAGGYLVQRNTSGSVTVPLTPTESNDATSKQYVDNLLASVYKVQGSQNVAGLNSLYKSSTMQGFVYNVSDSGNLTNQNSSTVAVTAGDNVVFIWNSGSWYWDKLAGDIDLSNYYTSAQVNNLLAGKRSVLSSSYLLYATDSTGAQSSVSYTKATTTGSDAIVQRNNGQIKVLLTPVANDDAASKKYVDDSIANVLTEQEALAILEGNNN